MSHISNSDSFGDDDFVSEPSKTSPVTDKPKENNDGEESVKSIAFSDSESQITESKPKDENVDKKSVTNKEKTDSFSDSFASDFSLTDTKTLDKTSTTQKSAKPDDNSKPAAPLSSNGKSLKESIDIKPKEEEKKETTDKGKAENSFSKSDVKRKSVSDKEPAQPKQESQKSKEEIINDEEMKLQNFKQPKIRKMEAAVKDVKVDLQAEVERLQNMVLAQRTVIEQQKQTIKLLMKEQINYEEMSKLRAALASKDPLLQLVAATPLAETRLTQDLRAENASLRREIDEIENRHLEEMKKLRAQYAQLAARHMPEDGCAACRRRIRELEDQLKSKQ